MIYTRTLYGFQSRTSTKSSLDDDNPIKSKQAFTKGISMIGDADWAYEPTASCPVDLGVYMKRTYKNGARHALGWPIVNIENKANA
jgi:hypothetical protein